MTLKLELSMKPGLFFIGSAGGVEKWLSPVGLRHQFLQATDANKPFATMDGILFDGSNDLLTVSDSSDWYLSNINWTFEVWLRKATNSAIYHAITGQSDSAQTEATLSWLWRINPTNKLEFAFKANGTNVIWASTGAVADMQWHHLVVTRDGNTGYMYIDGQPDATTYNFTGVSMYDSSELVSIGRVGTYTGYHMNGYLNDFRLYHSCIYPGGVAFSTPPRSDCTLKSLRIVNFAGIFTAVLNQFDSGD